MFERVPKDKWHWTKTRSSRSNFFFKIGVLENFGIFTGIQSLKGFNFIKDRHQHRGFPVNVAQFLRKAFLWNISAGCFCKRLIIFTEVWVRTLSNIYDGAFCRNSENLSTIFTKNPISDVWWVPKHASASKRFLKLIYNIRPVEMKKNLRGCAFIKNCRPTSKSVLKLFKHFKSLRVWSLSVGFWSFNISWSLN